MIGLANNIDRTRLVDEDGFDIVYEEDNSVPTTDIDLNEIQQKCSAQSVICLAGLDQVDPEVFDVVACGNCLNILDKHTVPTLDGSL